MENFRDPLSRLRVLKPKTVESAAPKTDPLRHPLVIALFSFFLTGIVGAMLSSWISQSYRDVERARQEVATRRQAVQEFSKLVYERRTRAELLASSIRRKAELTEIRQRKKDYDEIYVRWNVESKANLILVREILGERDYSSFENAVEFGLVSKHLVHIDACLTKAYDQITAVAPDLAQQTLNECKMRDLLGGALSCGYAISDELYQIANNGADILKSEIEIRQRCYMN